MGLMTLGHPLAILRDGATAFTGQRPHPLPLAETRIDIHVRKGFATVELTRAFRNVEGEAIEAVITFPVPFEATLVALEAVIDGRRLKGVAKGRHDARETYEDAVSTGKAAVLHEEPLRGLHVLSVGNLAPGQTARVTSRYVMPVSLSGETPFLRIPLTAGEIYGQSPLAPADALVTDETLKLSGHARVTVEGEGRATALDGSPFGADWFDVDLGRAIEIMLPGLRFGEIEGVSADGRRVRLAASIAQGRAKPLDIAILVDRSGSTSSNFDGVTVWHAMKQAVQKACASFGPEDRASIWQFDDSCEKIASGAGPSLAHALAKLKGPNGGTELGGAISAVIADGAKPILVLTDGQTHHHDVQAAALQGAPIFPVLVGDGSLSSGAGHLAAISGGQVFNAARGFAQEAVASAIAAMRNPGGATQARRSDGRLASLRTMRGGVTIDVAWHGEAALADCDAIGAYAASLALGALPEGEAETLAVAHGLASHLTSLVLVDEAGERREGLPNMRKVALPAVSERGAAIMSRLVATNDEPPIASLRCLESLDAKPKLSRRNRLSDLRGSFASYSRDLSSTPARPLREALQEYANLRMQGGDLDSLTMMAGGGDDPFKLVMNAAQDFDICDLANEADVSELDILLLGFLLNEPKLDRALDRLRRKLKAEISADLHERIREAVARLL